MTSALAQIIADAADVVAPEAPVVYPEVPEWAWGVAHHCEVCDPLWGYGWDE